MRNLAFFSIFLLLGSAAFAQVTVGISGPTPVAVQNGATSAKSPQIKIFQKIEDTWSNAVNQRNQYALELVLSPLFVNVSASGDITTRNQQVASVLFGDDKNMHLEQHVVTVRMLGDMAVVNGTYTLYHKVNSKRVDEKGVFTHVFERKHGKWMCINSQRTLVRQNPRGKHKKLPTNESAFHIPFFGR